MRDYLTPSLHLRSIYISFVSVVFRVSFHLMKVLLKLLMCLESLKLIPSGEWACSSKDRFMSGGVVAVFVARLCNCSGVDFSRSFCHTNVKWQTWY